MRGVLVVVAILLGACKRHEPAKPLPEAILGEWDVWCRTDKEATSTCLGKEDFGLYKVFEPGGGFESGSHQNGAHDRGSWSLDGDELVLTIEGGGLQETERYRARIVGDRLVLWDAAEGFGSVLGRAGVAFAAAAGPTTSGGPVTRQIGAIRYSIALPGGYRLARDDNSRQRWEPASGAGLVVELTLTPRPREEVDGKDVVTPCDHHDDQRVASSGETIEGVERVTSIGVDLCIDPGDQALMCSAGHSRGYLEPAEKDAALALCTSLAVAR